jgi:hypothetical protein
VRKHEIGTEEKVVELYPNNNDIETSHYVKKIKEHEARRASTNERQNYWKTYREYLK